MQKKQTNKHQLEDYFQVAANRGSMYNKYEIEQLISSGKLGKKNDVNSKNNLLKILAIMTLLTATIAMIIWMINPVEQKIAQKESTVNKPGETSSNSHIKKENVKPEISKSTFRQKPIMEKRYNKINEKKDIKQVAKFDNIEKEAKIDTKIETENKVNTNNQETSELKKSAPEKIKDEKQIKLEGIKIIELSREELLQLGYRISGDSVFTRTNGLYTFGYSMDGTILKIHSKDATGKKIKPKKVKFINPDLVTDDLGNWRSYTDKRPEKVREFKLQATKPADNYKRSDSSKPQFTLSEIRKVKDEKTGKKVEIEVPYKELQKESEQRILDKINTFIPILIRTGIPYTIEDSINKRHRPDLIVWYEVTNDFLKTLPKDLRKKIENEYAQITKQPEKSENTINASNCEYFEVCRSTLKSASNVVVFPNPAFESANMRFNLKEDASLRINLFDISGRLVKELKSFSQFSAGPHEMPLNLDGVTEGMYLIVLESEQGETNIQRIVKGKR